MKTLDFTLRLVTPAFLAGACGAEGFRIPALRGVLRFWYRAKEGDSGEEGYASRLFDRESGVFGSARDGQGVRFIPREEMKGRLESIRARGDLRHLGFGPLAPDPRKALVAGTEVRLRAVGTEEQLTELRRCLILLHCFGGLGGRSRRGWGSVEVEAEGLLPPEAGEGSFSEWLGEALARVWPPGTMQPCEHRGLPRHSAFSRNTRLGLLEVGGSAMTALGDLAGRYKEVAQDRSLRGVEEESGEGEELKRAAPRVALGLPWSGKNEHGEHVEYSARPVGGRAEAITRRASPLLFKVLPHPDGGHRIVALYLKGQFLPEGEVHVERGGKVAPPGDGAIDTLLAGWRKLSPTQISG